MTSMHRALITHLLTLHLLDDNTVSYEQVPSVIHGIRVSFVYNLLMPAVWAES